MSNNKSYSMRIIAVIIAITFVGMAAVALIHGRQSRQAEAPGLVDGRLSRCPDKPSCASSEYQRDGYQLVPAVAVVDADQALEKASAIIEGMGGTVDLIEGDYLASTFSRRIVGFVDDFELRLDREHNVLHVRSNARVGYGDLGANRKRVEHFNRLFSASK